MTDQCIVCGNNYKKKTKRVYYEFNCCSKQCVKNLDSFRSARDLKRYKSALTNANIIFDDKNEKQIRKLYSNLMSEKTKVSTAKKHETMCQRGDLKAQYVLAGKKSRATMLTKLNSEGMSLGDFNMMLGQKSIKAKTEKHGSLEKVIEHYQEIVNKQAADYCGIVLDEHTPVAILKECRKIYMRAKKMYNHDPLAWKKTHLQNLNPNLDIKSLPEEEIHKQFSEYISNRYQMRNIENNGYKKTKKGYYVFTSNQNPNKFFFRSSWEESVLAILDGIALEYKASFFVPDRIPFIFQGIKRHYFPDIGFICHNRKYIFEIKPYCKVNTDINQAKFLAAKELLGLSFVVITEHELNNNTIRNIIKG